MGRRDPHVPSARQAKHREREGGRGWGWSCLYKALQAETAPSDPPKCRTSFLLPLQVGQGQV